MTNLQRINLISTVDRAILGSDFDKKMGVRALTKLSRELDDRMLKIEFPTLRKDAPYESGPGKYTPAKPMVQDPGNHVVDGNQKIRDLQANIASQKARLSTADDPGVISTIRAKITSLEDEVRIHQDLQKPNYGPPGLDESKPSGRTWEQQLHYRGSKG